MGNMLGKVSLASSIFPRERGSHATPPTSSNPVAERVVVDFAEGEGAKAEVEATRAVVSARVSLAILVLFGSIAIASVSLGLF